MMKYALEILIVKSNSLKIETFGILGVATVVHG